MASWCLGARLQSHKKLRIAGIHIPEQCNAQLTAQLHQQAARRPVSLCTNHVAVPEQQAAQSRDAAKQRGKPRYWGPLQMWSDGSARPHKRLSKLK